MTWLSPRKDERAARYDQPVSSQRGDTRAVRSQLTAAIATDRKNGTPREKRVSGPKQSGQYSGGEDVGQVASPRQDAVPVGQPGIPAEVRVNEEEWRRVTSELKRIVSLGPGPDRLREIAEVILDSAAQT